MKKILLTSFLALFAQDICADFISLIRADQCETIIEVFIEEHEIRITLETGMNDLVHFKEMLPADLLPDYSEHHERETLLNDFFNNRFILEVDGHIIRGIITRQELIPRIYRASLYTGVVDTSSTISKEVLFTEIKYPLNKRPYVISITPPIDEGYQTTMASIGFIAYHKDIPVNDLRYLGNTETVRLDWNDPWYSKFDNRNLKRHHSSSLLSFLYIDPYEVRHEVLVRIKDLDYWIDLGYGIDDKINIADQQSLKDTVANFLKYHNIVTIDGKQIPPVVDRVHWVKWSLSGIQILEVQQELDYSSAVIGVIFAYPHDSIAQEAVIDWDLFNERITTVPNVATDPAGPMPYILQPNDHQLIWKNYLKKYKLPTITEVKQVPLEMNLLVILGVLMLLTSIVILRNKKRKKMGKNTAIAGAVLFFSGFLFHVNVGIPFIKQTSFSKPEAESLISQLLKNTYRAFDFREESDVYDKLAVSSDGELLSEIYIQTKKGMTLENQGGLKVKVKDVVLSDVSEVESNHGELAYGVKWVVKGDVGHWGHIHRRINQYSAVLNIKPIDGVWKLFDIDIIEEKRLK